MKTLEELKMINKYENEVLEVIENSDKFTHSDLQARISAIVMNIMNESKNLK